MAVEQSIQERPTSFSDQYEFIILAGTASPKLAEAVGQLIGNRVYYPVGKFPDGEIKVDIEISMRRKPVLIIQSTYPPDNSRYFQEIGFLADAARRSSAGEITAVIPYFGYSRQDRMNGLRSAIGASLQANDLVNAGVERIVTIDLHSEQIMGSIQKPWDNLYASYCLIRAIKGLGLPELVVASPDAGGVHRAIKYQEFLNGTDSIAIVYKTRDPKNPTESKVITMIGEVEGRDVLITDDILDSGRTIVSAAKLLKERGARTIRAAIAHGEFSGSAMEKINESAIQQLFITDTIPAKEEIAKHPKVTVVSVAPLLAEAIRRIHLGQSISELFHQVAS